MEYKSTVSKIDRTLENKNLKVSQTKLEKFSNLYSQQLRDKVKAIKLRQDKEFLEQYFKDYFKSSEGIKENGDRE